MDMAMWEDYIIWLESLLWMGPVYLLEREVVENCHCFSHLEQREM